MSLCCATCAVSTTIFPQVFPQVSSAQHRACHVGHFMHPETSMYEVVQKGVTAWLDRGSSFGGLAAGEL